MAITIITAHDLNKVIGVNGRLPWKVKSDLKHFQKTTNGHVVIMGSKTWCSLSKPLKNRINLIVTRDESSVTLGKYKGDPNYKISILGSLDAAIAFAKETHPDKEIFIIGGQSIYEQALTVATDMIITKLNCTVTTRHTADSTMSFFPDYNGSDWVKSRESRTGVDDDSKIQFRIEYYGRKQSADEIDNLSYSIMCSTFALNELMHALDPLMTRINAESLEASIGDGEHDNPASELNCFIFDNFHVQLHEVGFPNRAYSIMWNGADGKVYQLPLLMESEYFAEDLLGFINKNAHGLKNSAYLREINCRIIQLGDKNIALTEAATICNYCKLPNYQQLRRMALLNDVTCISELGLKEEYFKNHSTILMLQYLLTHKGK